MKYLDKDAAFSDAVKLLIGIKKGAMAARLTPSLKHEVTPEGQCLTGIEGDVEEWLNELALDNPEMAEGWKMTPDFADDHA